MRIPSTVIDQHVHTSFSPDSEERLENIVRHALELGKKAIVTTDHVDFDCTYFKRDIVIDMPAYCQEVEVLRQKYEMDIRMGAEMGYRQDYQEQIHAFLNQHDFDIILLSVHNNGVLDFGEEAFHEQGTDVVFRDYFECLYRAVSSLDSYDVVAHFDYFVRYSKNLFDSRDYQKSKAIIYDILKVMIQNNKVLELNTAGLLRDRWIHPHTDIIRMYLDLGGRFFSLGSDAHQLGHYEQGFEEAIELLKAFDVHEIVQFKKRQPEFVPI